MKQLMDTAATVGGGASSTEPARPKVTPMSPEIIGVRRVAVTMETMQVADIEKETTWETVSITYADAPISVVAQEGFKDRGGRGYDDFVPGEVTKAAPSGDRVT